jgi:hypothetical protein
MRRELDRSSGGATMRATLCRIGWTSRSRGASGRCVVTAAAVTFGRDIEAFVCCACKDERNAVTGPCVAANEPIAAGKKNSPMTQMSVSTAVRKFRQAGIELSTTHPTLPRSGA